MRQRIYVMLPDLPSAKRLADDLLLARVEDRHMHFLARRGTPLGELREASYLQKSDTLHGAMVGLVIGGAIGALVGFALVQFPPGGVSVELVAVLVSTIVGSALGMWVASMVGLQVPNSRLKGFQEEIEAGRILLILDVPAGRGPEVREVIARTHPEAVDRGNEPTVPAFP
jgi:uncharacterized membrane protein YeaQ/YmgE (transglycosylase-associated protein family)